MRTNRLAIWSLILAVLWLGGLGALVAIILGIVAIGEIGRTKEPGRGLAIAGLVIGLVGLVLPVLIVLAPFVRSSDDGDHLGSCAAQYATASTAAEAYYADHQVYPDTAEARAQGYLDDGVTDYSLDGGSSAGIELTPEGASHGCTIDGN